jgi:hypothetical protein
LAGGVLGQVVVLEGVKGVKYASMPAEIYKNSEKHAVSLHFLAYKLPKTPFFAQ